MLKFRSVARVLVAALLLAQISGGGVLAQQQKFQRPVDPRVKLAELDDAVLVKQRALFAARQRGNQEAVKRLTEEFKKIQEQRSTLVTAVRRVE